MTATLSHLVLLAGLGPHGDGHSAPVSPSDEEQADLGTCLDGGGEIVVSLTAPGGRRLGVFERDRHAPAVPGGSRWSWWKQERGGPAVRGTRVLLTAHAPDSWDLVAAATDGGTPALRHWHRVLGPAARIYSLTTQADTGPDGVWVAWQLDPAVPVDRALRALQATQSAAATQSAVAALGTLVPTRLAPDRGPWSLAVRADGARVRIGTARWARWHEDDGKRRRAVAAVRAFGGDGRFAEGAYKLALAATAGPRPARVGRAAEVELARTESGELAPPHELELFLTIGRS